MEDQVPFGSGLYFVFLVSLLIGRGMDLLSTWVATPRLTLEANPLARKLGWKWGMPLNLGICMLLSAWPLPAIMLATTSVLVAARNFQSAWLMRSMGEGHYRLWMSERLAESNRLTFVSCLVGQAVLVGAVGLALVSFTKELIPFAIGTGIITYAVAVTFFTILSVWRIWRVTP